MTLMYFGLFGTYTLAGAPWNISVKKFLSQLHLWHGNMPQVERYYPNLGSTTLFLEFLMYLSQHLLNEQASGVYVITQPRHLLMMVRLISTV